MTSKNNVLILRFPSHATHVLQPLDVSFFGPFKSVLARIKRNRIVCDNERLGRENFAEIIEEVWSQIENKWLKTGFIMTGILTDNGINSQAITCEQLKGDLPYTDGGITFLKSTAEEFDEITFPEEQEEMNFLVTKFKNTITSLTNPPIKRKIISIMSYFNLNFKFEI